jgi:NTP pyrophosphatase (non-canonical NTP hydrolase)
MDDLDRIDKLMLAHDNRPDLLADTALRLERERDEARTEVEMMRDAPALAAFSAPMRRAAFDALQERLAQDKKWGEQNHDPFCYLTILVEEVGELAQAALHARYGGPAAAGLRDEAVQVAAVALAIVECIDRGKWKWGGHALRGEEGK